MKKNNGTENSTEKPKLYLFWFDEKTTKGKTLTIKKSKEMQKKICIKNYENVKIKDYEVRLIIPHKKFLGFTISPEDWKKDSNYPHKENEEVYLLKSTDKFELSPGGEKEICSLELGIKDFTNKNLEGKNFNYMIFTETSYGKQPVKSDWLLINFNLQTS